MARNVAIGIQDFEQLITNDYFYIDKTDFIREWWDSGDSVTLITRPRRFGKTLVMSMLSEFFDIRKDNMELFEGLNISDNKKLCQKWMNQFPTLFFSFKDVDGLTFSSAYDMLTMKLADLFRQHQYLLESNAVDDGDKAAFT